MSKPNTNRCRRVAFTLVELLVVIVICVIVLFMLLPAVRSGGDAGRRASCLNKVKQIVLSFHNYASSFDKAFPPSAQTYTTDGGGTSVGGYSFLVKLLPYMENDSLYRTLPVKIPNGDLDAAMSTNPPLAQAMHTSMREFICPANHNGIFQQPNATPPQFALTNYKAIGASTKSSLTMVINPTATPPYGTAKMHPDGAIYPSDKNLPMSDISDGLSHTIIIMETIDDTNSRWMVGAECTMVGLPQASSPTGEKPTPPYTYFAPPGYNGELGDNSAVARAGLRTFLEYDFSPTGADAGKYEDPGWAKAPPAYGPSSAHPTVIITGMADGSVQSLSKRVDAANLFFLITKNNADPFNTSP